MPTTTCARAISTSAIPTVMPTTTPTPINPSPVPIPLPQWQSPMAPTLTQKTLQLSAHIFSDYASLAKVAQLTPGKHLAQSTHYLTEEDKYDWANLSEFEATLPDRLSSGSIPMPGQHSYHQSTWVDLSMRNPSKRSTPWMISLCSIG